MENGVGCRSFPDAVYIKRKCYPALLTVAEPRGRGHGPVAGGSLEPRGEAAAVVAVVVDQVGDGATAMLLREEEVAPGILFDVVVLDVRMGPAEGEARGALAGAHTLTAR